MANSFTQLYVQMVFAVKNRQSLIFDENKDKLMRSRFEWQTGYGAFTYGQSQINSLKEYIANQGNHHKKRKFKEEYIALLNAFEIDYDETYLFDWIDWSLPPTEAGESESLSLLQ